MIGFTCDTYRRHVIRGANVGRRQVVRFDETGETGVADLDVVV